MTVTGNKQLFIMVKQYSFPRKNIKSKLPGQGYVCTSLCHFKNKSSRATVVSPVDYGTKKQFEVRSITKC